MNGQYRLMWLESVIAFLYPMQENGSSWKYFISVIKQNQSVFINVIHFNQYIAIFAFIIHLFDHVPYRIPKVMVGFVVIKTIEIGFTAIYNKITTSKGMMRKHHCSVLFIFVNILNVMYLLSFSVSILTSEDRYRKGLLISLYFLSAVLGFTSIFKSFRLSMIVTTVCSFPFAFQLLYNPSSIQEIYFLALIIFLILSSMHQIDKFSLTNYISGKEIKFEHSLLTLFADNSPDAIIILIKGAGKNSKTVIKYYNSIWAQEPFNIKNHFQNDEQFTNLFQKHFVSADQSLYDIIFKKDGKLNTISSSNYAIHIDNHPQYHYSVNIFKTMDKKSNLITFVQYHNNSSEIQLTESKTRSGMLCSITHELLTPLNPIMNVCNKNNKLEMHDFRVLKVNCRLLYLKIMDFISYSEHYKGTDVIKEDHCDLLKSIKEVYELYTEEADSKSIEYHMVITPTEPHKIFCDCLKIKQIVNNLISNAIKFTPKFGTVLIVITTYKEQIEISIEDTGSGIDLYLFHSLTNFNQKFATKEEDMPTIHDAAPRKLGSVGLAVCAILCNIIKTTLKASSSKGKGSKMSFTVENKMYRPNDIPIERSSTEYIILNDEYTNDNKIKGVSKPSISIVIADDIYFNRFTIKEMLTNLVPNISLYEAINGLEVIKCIKTILPFSQKILILMDVDMPLMDGISATREIRKMEVLGKNIVIIGVTAFSSENQLKECIHNGMNEAITKPLAIEKLRKILSCVFKIKLPL